MAVNPNSNTGKGFSSGTQGPTAIPMPMPGSEEDLRKKTPSEQSVEQAPLTKNEENLRKLIEMRRELFEKINDPNTEKVKSGLPGDFLYKSDYFVMAKEFLENAATFFKLPQIANSFAKGLNEMIEEYNPSPDVTKHFNKIMNGGADPNGIKLNVQENIFKQLEKIGVTDKIDEKISGFARYLDKNRPHFVPMELPDGKFLFLDINRYDRDREQLEAPPLGPQESNQKQPALGPIKGILRKPAEKIFAEKHPENQENSFEKNTPHAIPNYLPELLSPIKTTFQASNKQPVAEGPPLGSQESNQEKPANGPQNTGDTLKNSPPERLSPKKGVVFGEDVIKEDGIKGKRGEWVSAITQRSTDGNSNNGQRGSR